MWTDYIPHFTLAAGLDMLAIAIAIPWVLMTKKESTSAVAWCLLVLLVPLFGVLLFWVFGHNHISRPLRRKRLHRVLFRAAHPAGPASGPGERADAPLSASTGRLTPAAHPPLTAAFDDLGQLALRVNAFPIRNGNAVTWYHDTQQAFDALLQAIRGARRHVHLQYFIFRPDAAGRQLLELLTQKAKEGVEVRLLYDAMGGRTLGRRFLRPLEQAGGKVGVFLPLNPLRSRIQINLRNHRKITIIDGQVAFTGGMNIGDEYLGRNAYFGYWRDEVLRLEGPAVADLQRIFVEDWDFARHEVLVHDAYFPPPNEVGDAVVQVAESGPDQEINTIREIYFAAIVAARERLWIASPYFVPDAGLLDALRLARYRGVDVRLLSLLRPDHYLSFYAGRYYWSDMLAVGVKVYQYAKGMMHSKLVMVDGRWAMAGSANLDNRSLRLNFEAVCLMHSPHVIAELERAYLDDLDDSILLDAVTFSRRSFGVRLVENGCRLLSPIL
ncbi:MAG TPA: cardiolipin synthase [Gemmataceae bacterium]|nr:cardiolipin synthase [Gemmataceae bacterium]